MGWMQKLQLITLCLPQESPREVCAGLGGKGGQGLDNCQEEVDGLWGPWP